MKRCVSFNDGAVQFVYDFRARHAAIIRSQSATSSAIGFSTSTCLTCGTFSP